MGQIFEPVPEKFQMRNSTDSKLSCLNKHSLTQTFVNTITESLIILLMASFKKVNGFLDRNASRLFISCICTCDDLFICLFCSSNTWKVYIHHFNIRFVGHTVQTLRETKLFSGDLTSRVYHKIHISNVCVSCFYLLQVFFSIQFIAFNVNRCKELNW